MKTFENQAFNAPLEELNILLLEDYNLDALLVEKRLKSENPNWVINHVDSKQDFRKALEDFSPDIILSDYAMPQFTGMEAYLTVKELGLSIPFIILTGELPEEAMVECVRQGVDDYVIKSSLTRLSLAIQNAILKKQQAHERAQMSTDLLNSEVQFNTIFENSGVAISEIHIPDWQEIANHKGKFRSADTLLFRSYLDRFSLAKANQEMMVLFEAQSPIQLQQHFGNIWSGNEVVFLKSIFRHISRQTPVFEEKAFFTSVSGAKIFLRAKFCMIGEDTGVYNVSFTDLTDVKRSEDRLNTVISRMESIVTERTEELNELNT
ncbi:MAG: response regulator, partial [Flavobacteriales bacterium]|nr:response regulator [Flavobacteriales bacterium]